MIVCSCNVLTDQDVRATMAANQATPRTTGQVYNCLGCSPQCGRCARTIRRIMNEALAGAATGCCQKACQEARQDAHQDARQEAGQDAAARP